MWRHYCQGYALRELKDDFMKKYKSLQPNAEDLEALVAYLSSMLGASRKDWQIGTSKVWVATSEPAKYSNARTSTYTGCGTRTVEHRL